jgi:hypothetical protein
MGGSDDTMIMNDWGAAGTAEILLEVRILIQGESHDNDPPQGQIGLICKHEGCGTLE